MRFVGNRIKRFMGWLAGAIGFASGASSQDKPTAVPILVFRPRAPSWSGLSDAELAKSVKEAGSRRFAARLRSVAVENCPSALAAKRGKTTPPAGKPIPKKVPRVLKSYRRSAPPRIISARQRSVDVTNAWRANVIELSKSLKLMRGTTVAPAARAA